MALKGHAGEDQQGEMRKMEIHQLFLVFVHLACNLEALLKLSTTRFLLPFQVANPKGVVGDQLIP